MSLRRSSRLSRGDQDAQSSRNTSTIAAIKDTVSSTVSAVKQTAKPTKRKARTSSGSKLDNELESSTAVKDEEQFVVPVAPQTPVAKRRKGEQNLGKQVPVTPTPAAIPFMMSSSPVPLPDPKTPLPRLAGPHVTNAPLQTPGGSHVTATPTAAKTDWTGGNGPKSSLTTSNILEEACTHLIKVDPKLEPLVRKYHCKMFDPEGLAEEVDPWRSLTSGIIGQQVSGAAAASIKRKFISVFPPSSGEAPPPPDNYFPSPALIATADMADLRSAGLSQRKAEYIQGLAQKFVSGELSAKMLIAASDEEVLEKLTAVRGLGRWSVEMFACFGLKRMDVFSTGDLGVQRGMATYVGRDVGKLKSKGGKFKYMSEKDMLDISARFTPYRSLFMWYMWRIEEVDISVMQK